MKKLIVILQVLFLLSNIQAQKSEFGIGLGFSTYYGDLSSDVLINNLKQSHPAGQIYYNYYISKYFNTRIALGHGTISGDDAFAEDIAQKERNLSFKSSITELSGLVEFNVLGLDYLINPYLFSGVNMFHFNPKTVYKGQWVYLQPLGTEGQGSELHPDRRKYNLTDISLVFGGGIKIKLSSSLMMSFELGWRRSNTDYLDDVSKDYVGYTELNRTNGQMAADLSDRTNEYYGKSEISLRPAGSKRGNNKAIDYYTMSFLNIAYTIHSGNPFKMRHRILCPGF